MLFSQRKGLKPVKKAFQKDDIDEELRNRLWNCLNIFYWRRVESNYNWVNYHTDIAFLCYRLWDAHFKVPIDTLDREWWSTNYEKVKKHFFACSWDGVFDFIEFIVKNYCYNEEGDYEEINSMFMKRRNEILEQENSAYRFVDGKITEITSEEEISEIERALEQPFKPVKVHLKRALELLSDRKNPDYRNSIKESISAVEAICKIITNNKKATLGDCLNKIKSKKHIKLHPALIEAFKKLYGYTSDAEGIRHPLLDEPALSYEDAKFMLVACSAFVNYVIAKASL